MANYLFTATTQRSGDSKVAQVMNSLNLDRVVYFVVRSGTEDQREELYDLTRQAGIVRLPLVSKRHPRSRRMLYIYRTLPHLSDLEHIRSYRLMLEHVFGEKCRVMPRVMTRKGVEA